MRSATCSSVELGAVVAQRSWTRRLAMAAVALPLAWLALGLCASVGLALQVPITAEHLHLASWLGNRGWALLITNGPMGTLLMILMLIGGMAIAAKRSVKVVAVAMAVIGLGGWVSLSEESQVRLGILMGTVKIGCYVENSQECRQQMGLPAEWFASRYMPEGSSYQAWQWSDWYRAERSKVVSDALERKAAWVSLPGASLALAPLYAFDGGRLSELVESQLEQARRRRVDLLAGK